LCAATLASAHRYTLAALPEAVSPATASATGLDTLVATQAHLIGRALALVDALAELTPAAVSTHACSGSAHATRVDAPKLAARSHRWRKASRHAAIGCIAAALGVRPTDGRAGALGTAGAAERHRLDALVSIAVQALADELWQADAPSIQSVALVALVERNVATAITTNAAAVWRQAQRNIQLVRADVGVDPKRALVVQLRFACVREAAQQVEAAADAALHLPWCDPSTLAVFRQGGFRDLR